MEEILKNILISYKRKVNNIINKLEQFGGKSKIDEVTDKIQNINELYTKTKNARDSFVTFNIEIDKLLKKIDEVANANTGDFGAIKIKLKEYKNKIQEFMSNKNLEFIEDDSSGYSLYSMTPTNELVDSFNNLLIAYKIIINDASDILFKESDLTNRTGQLLMYSKLIEKLNKKIDPNIVSSNMLLTSIKNRIEQIKRNTINIKDVFSVSDIKFAYGKIDYETKDITFTDGTVGNMLNKITIFDRKAIKIEPVNLQILLEISSELLGKTFSTDNSYNLDTKYSDTKKFESNDDLFNTVEYIMHGGSYADEITIFKTKIFNLYEKINECHDLLDEMVNLTVDYQLTMERNYNYLSFLLLILLEPYKKYDEEIFLLKYIEYGYITVIRDILKKLIERINSNDNSKIIKYFSRYHYVVISNLLNFLNFLLNELNEQADKFIDIDKCKGTVRNYFFILQNFSPVLDKYMEISKV
jgi:hypothetical protein